MHGSNYATAVWLAVLACAALFDNSASLQQCHACFGECRLEDTSSPDLLASCDCRNATCWGERCYAKLELWPEEKIAAIQKGCSSEIPGREEGCQHAGRRDSIHCYCKDDLCNSVRQLNHYAINPLPRVDCCQCAESQADVCDGDGGCAKRCTGNYCFNDIVSSDQGCGWGQPPLLSFLRTPDYNKWRINGTCARYEAGSRSLVHGCLCSKAVGDCNRRETTIETLAARTNTAEDKHFCYSLHTTSKRPIDEGVFKRAGTCEGHFCFITTQTYEVSIETANFADHHHQSSNVPPPSQQQRHYVARMTPYYELLAGCLDVDDAGKVTDGCSVEYQTNATAPLKKHCVCRSHLCNYYRRLLLDGNGGGTSDAGRPTRVDQEDGGDAEQVDGGTDDDRRRHPSVVLPEDIPVPEDASPTGRATATNGRSSCIFVVLFAYQLLSALAVGCLA